MKHQPTTALVLLHSQPDKFSTSYFFSSICSFLSYRAKSTRGYRRVGCSFWRDNDYKVRKLVSFFVYVTHVARGPFAVTARETKQSMWTAFKNIESQYYSALIRDNRPLFIFFPSPSIHPTFYSPGKYT